MTPLMKKTLHKFTFALANNLVVLHLGGRNRDRTKAYKCQTNATLIKSSFALGCILLILSL